MDIDGVSLDCSLVNLVDNEGKTAFDYLAESNNQALIPTISR